MKTTTGRDGPTALTLGALPILGAAIRKLGIREIVDEHAPPDPRMNVTHGQCVEAMIVSILRGVRPLYLMDQELARCDLRVGLGWKETAGNFHDQRLGRALDALAKVGQLVTDAAALRSVSAWKLSLSLVHMDLTAQGVYGDYSASHAPEDPEEPDAVPHVKKGKSKDGRRGMKQIVYGTAVTSDGRVPLVGRASSGSRSEPLELRFLMRRLGSLIPDPSETTLVGDSKLCAGESLELARELGFDLVTLMPRSVNLQRRLLKDFDERKKAGDVQLLAERENPHDKVLDRWEGYSMPVTYGWRDADDKRRTIEVRALVVESSQLARAHSVTLEAKREQELEEHTAAARAAWADTYECLADATKAAEKLVAGLKSKFHVAAPLCKVERIREKRARAGRPVKDAPPPAERDVFRASFAVERREGAFEEQTRRASRFVLLTTHPQEGDRSRTDVQIFDAYHGQWKVEANMRALKAELAFGPVHLHSDVRIGALARVYMLALMVYALIERDARAELARSGSTIAGNLGDTETPTTAVVLRLFEPLTTVRLPGERKVVLQNLTVAHVEGFARLGCAVLSRSDLLLSKARTPMPGDRGYYHPREFKRRLPATAGTGRAG